MALELSLRRLTSLSLPPPSMDNLPDESAGFTNNSTACNRETRPGMFTGSQNFTVTGHTFNNITNQYAASVPSDFRMIPLGDIDLQHEIQVDRVVVGRRCGQGCVRRVYSAKVEGRKSDFTVAMYQGNGAEEEWWQQLAKYISLRHPNIVQIYGAASSGGIHATLFYDHLVPFQQYVDTYRYSHFVTVYFYACCTVDFHAASDHVYSTFQRDLYPNEYTMWIRPSSGQLCAELIPSSTRQPYLYHNPAGISYSHRISSAVDMELMVVESLTTKWYHNICGIYLSQFRTISISTSTTVNLGAIISCSPGHPLEDPVEIADTPNVYTSVDVWESCEGAEGVVMEDGRTCFKSHDVSNRTIKLGIWAPTSRVPWLSQANSIFRGLRITSNFEDYVLVCDVYFELKVPGTTEEPPAGFLFLSPRKDFRTGPSSYRWPDSPAYWSLNPSGVDRLTLEEATRLGFPTFQRTTEVVGRSWDASVYEGLRKFHRAKGFNPDTQELARHLGHPLFELSAEADSTFAHVDEGDFKATEEQPRAAEDEHESYDPQTEASVSEDVDTNTEGSHPEQDNHDSVSVRTNCGADHSAENMNSENQASSAPNTSSVAEKKPNPPTFHAKKIALSETLKFLMIFTLVLMLFLGFSWLYKQI